MATPLTMTAENGQLRIGSRFLCELPKTNDPSAWRLTFDLNCDCVIAAHPEHPPLWIDADTGQTVDVRQHTLDRKN